MPALWSELAADGAVVRAPDPSDLSAVGVIVATAPTMAEARTRAARVLLTALGPSGLLASYPGGAPAVLNAVANLSDPTATGGEEFAPLIVDLLASAFRHVVYTQRTQEEGDAWSVRRDGEMAAMRETAKILSYSLPRVLGSTVSDTGGTGSTGDVLVFYF